MLYEQKQMEDDNQIPTFQDLIKFITKLERSYEIIQAESPPSSPPSTCLLYTSQLKSPNSTRQKVRMSKLKFTPMIIIFSIHEKIIHIA